jgi:molecular chaperone DnaK (HSP70)
VAAWKNGSVDIISPETQGRRIPSYVAFRDGRLLIGEEAKAQVSRNATNTVFSIKRLVGADPARPEVQNIVKHWPFKVQFETRNRTVVSGEACGPCTLLAQAPPAAAAAWRHCPPLAGVPPWPLHPS